MSADLNIENLQAGPVFFRCVDDSNDTVMLTDKKGELFYVNKAWQKTYGYTLEEVLGLTPAILRSKHQEAGFYHKMWNAILDPNRGYWRGELINKAKDGTEVPVFLTITPYRDATGIVQGYMGIAVDITEKKQLEAQVQHQDRLASIGLIASGLAHEIGTPLGVIRGRAEYLQMLLDKDSNLKGNLDIIVTQIDRISKLIYSLLHLARKSDPNDVRPISVKEVAEEVFSLLSQKARKDHVEIRNSLGDDVLVLAEASQLEQVLLNLVMNALQAIETATAEGRKDQHCISLHAHQTKQEWVITVEDTGCGIAEEALRKIFKPFFTTKEVGVGTGLGLAITEQIIQSWGGSIKAESTVGIGTRFTLKLPKAN